MIAYLTALKLKTQAALSPRTPSDAPNAEQGSGLVEMALVLPVVLILTLGIVQFGVLGFAASAADNAARQGARVGSVARLA